MNLMPTQQPSFRQWMEYQQLLSFLSSIPLNKFFNRDLNLFESTLVQSTRPKHILSAIYKILIEKKSSRASRIYK